MSEKRLNVLVIEDNDNDYKLLMRALTKENTNIDSLRVDTAETLAQAFKDRTWDIVISDNNIPDRRVSVKSSLMLTHSINPNTPFIIVSGTIGEENAIQLMKLGVQDYILKDNIARLGPAVKREIADAAVRIKKNEAEKKLLDSQERYRMLAESITDMFFALDINLMCTFWNKAAEKMTGIDLYVALGKHLFDIMPETSASPLKEKLLESFTTFTSTTIEIEYKRGNYDYYYQVTIYPSAEMHSIIVKDITESKNITRKLRSVNEELETFIYRLSHDLRGPLASVQGLINLAKTEQVPFLDSDFFSRINIMANRMDNVISGFQDVVKIKQEYPQLQETTFSKIMEQSMLKLDSNSCEVTVQTDAGEDGDKITTDPDFLVIALENLLSNAVSYRHPSRQPALLVQFSRKEKEFFQIIVSDNGIGIPEDLHDKIFNMFFRGNTQSSGPGLGLYLAINAVEKLGGTIRVKSTVEEGSSFSIRLPIDPKELGTPPEQYSVDVMKMVRTTPSAD